MEIWISVYLHIHIIFIIECPEKQNQYDVYVYIKKNLFEEVHLYDNGVEDGKSKICRAGQQSGDPEDR